MNLAPLYGETAFYLTEEGGDAPFTFLIPHEVVDEAGSLANLEAVLRIQGPKNPLRTILLTLEASGDNYTAQATLTNYQYDTVGYSVTFTDSPK